MIYDGMLVLALWLFTLFPIVAVANDFVYGPAVRGLLFLELFGFFAYFWMYRGQTLGMLAWGLELRSVHGPRLSLSQAILRFIGALLGLLAAGIGYLWLLVDPGRRAWPDLLSGSVVVHVPKRRR
jgi:uncharacterized RDD family membrane protein YckC